MPNQSLTHLHQKNHLPINCFHAKMYGTYIALLSVASFVEVVRNKGKFAISKICKRCVHLKKMKIKIIFIKMKIIKKKKF